MGNNSKAKKTSKTGNKTKLRKKPIMVKTWLVTKEIKIEIGDFSYGNYKYKYNGGLKKSEKKLCRFIAGNILGIKANLRYTIYVARDNSNKKDLLFNVLKNSNKKVLSIEKLSKNKSINKMVKKGRSKSRKNNITLDGWSGDEKKVVWSSIGALTGSVLGMLENLSIHRLGGNPPADSEADDAQGPGAWYEYEHHKIEVFDSGMKHGPQGARLTAVLGNPPDLPADAHTILHEVGHVIAYAEERRAKQEYHKELRNMINKWSTGSQSCLDKLPSSNKEKSNSKSEEQLELSRGIPMGEETNPDSKDQPNYFKCTYNNGFKTKWDNPKSVKKKHKNKYKKDLNRLNKKSKEYKNIGKGKVIKKFENEIMDNNVAPITPYSKEGAEEFFAEAFAVYKWDPEWLKKYRKEVWKFFNNNKHIQN